ncbi:hypothetical protein BGX38DRAFT_1267588 [Terfezia claveryi]|nr:hypothetical protein BGX38DRAFT_1267588 [Terfezia claveryi]
MSWQAVFVQGSYTIARIEEYIKPLKTDLTTVKTDVHKLKADVHKSKLDGEIIDTKLNVMNDNILAWIIATGQGFAGDRRGLAQLAAKMQRCKKSGGTDC